MPFFKICFHFKRSLSGAGLHKQITCEREKTTSRVKPQAENLISEHFLEEAVQHSAQTAPYRYYISKSLSTAQRHSEPDRSTTNPSSESSSQDPHIAEAEVSVIQQPGGKSSSSDDTLGHAAVLSPGPGPRFQCFMLTVRVEF